MHPAGKIFVTTYLKAFRVTFFPQYVEFPNMLYFYPTEEESLNFQTCRKTLPSPVPSFSGITWYPHEENPEGAWSAYSSDFLSKQNIYSM